MNKLIRNGMLAAMALAGVTLAGGANASLVTFQTFTSPNQDVSMDGCGSSTATCTLTNVIPVGSIIQAAYLYSSTFNTTTNPNDPVTLTVGANTVTPTYTALGANGALQAWRADVTAFVIANQTATSWTVNEGTKTALIDGEALVIVYTNPSLASPTTTVAILDGFSASGGDTSNLTFTALPAGFTAQLMIGDGFSFDGTDPAAPTDNFQVSTIKVNNTTLTANAGHCDDSQNPCQNGNLITVGGINAAPPKNDTPPGLNPTVGADHERYDLGLILAQGNTSATLLTNNPSNDDNIFLEVFKITGNLQVTQGSVPEPSSLALFAAALAGLGLYSRRRRSQS